MDGISFKRGNSRYCLGFTVLYHIPTDMWRLEPTEAKGLYYAFSNAAQKCMWEVLYYLGQAGDTNIVKLGIAPDWRHIALRWQRLNGRNYVCVEPPFAPGDDLTELYDDLL